MGKKQDGGRRGDQEFGLGHVKFGASIRHPGGEAEMQGSSSG